MYVVCLFDYLPDFISLAVANILLNWIIDAFGKKNNIKGSSTAALF